MTTKKTTPRKAKTRAKTPEGKIRYLINKTDGDIIVEIADSWRFTFGYVNPSKSGDAYRSGQGHCIRFYEGEKLRAVIGNCTGIRDLSIPLAKKFEKESGQTNWSRDSEGNFEENRKLELESGYVVEEPEDVLD